MDNSWVKLYRKAADNPVLFDDKALRVFFWLLTQVDKKTGKITIARFRTSETLKLNPNTFKDVLKRLEKKYEIITSKSTNKYTEISLLNWAKYNPYHENTPAPTPTKHQQNTNKTPSPIYITRHIDNKTISNNTNTSKKLVGGNKEINLILEEFEKAMGKIPVDRKPRNIAQHIRQLIKGFMNAHGETFILLRGRELTQEYILQKSWEYMRSKDYMDKLERLETFKQHMKVYLHEINKKLIEERRIYDEGANETGFAEIN